MKMTTMKLNQSTSRKKQLISYVEQESDTYDGIKRISEFIEKYPTIANILKKFDEVLCRPAGEHLVVSLADVLVLIPCLQPRQYSISSSDLISSRRLSIAAGVVNYVTNKEVSLTGACSNYLAGLTIGKFVKLMGVHQRSC